MPHRNLIVECGVSVPVYYTDAVGMIETLGHNVRVTFAERRMMGGKSILMPVVEIVHPVDAFRVHARKLGAAVSELFRIAN